MSGVGGLSIASNLLANTAETNFNSTQTQLQSAVEHLSSGLRINTAADDPSGLAISQSLQSQVNGFDQAALNIQQATNAATVASGALQTITSILQQIRTLAVAGASGTQSSADLQASQTEITQLLAEVNSVANSATFNGISLLNGSHAGFQAGTSASISIYTNTALATNGGYSTTNGTNYGLLAATVNYGAGFNTTAGSVQAGNTAGGTVDGTIELQVINTGSSIAVQESFVNSATGAVSLSPYLFSAYPAAGSKQNIAAVPAFDNTLVTFGTFSSADVGATAYIKIDQNVATASNPSQAALSFQTGAVEGSTLRLGLAATSTASLRIANINLLASSATNPTLGSEDAIGQIDNALSIIGQQQAVLGSATIDLGESLSYANVAALNLQTAESQLTDVNVAQETTQYTQLQILSSVGASVIAQANSNPSLALKLFP